jgi:MoxR-like ATPase
MNHKFKNIPKEELKEIFRLSINALNNIVIGQEFQLGLFFSCLVAKEHVAFVGESGCGKTYLVENFIDFFKIEDNYETITGHPEIMPQDFTVKHVMKDQEIYSYAIKLQKENTALFFVDEYNRISPKSLNVLLKPLNNGTLDDEINDTVKKVGFNLNNPFYNPKKSTQQVGTKARIIKHDNLIKEIEDRVGVTKDSKEILLILKTLADDFSNYLEKLKKSLVREKEALDSIVIDSLPGDQIQAMAKEFSNQTSFQEDADKRRQIYEKSIKEFVLETILNVKRAGTQVSKIENTALFAKLSEYDDTKRRVEQGEKEFELVSDLYKTCVQDEPYSMGGLNSNKVLVQLNRLIGGSPEISGEGLDEQVIEESAAEQLDDFFFFCVLASNPTSRGGNFPPPDALLDRLGMEVLFYPLTADQKANIPDSEQVSKETNTARVQINKIMEKYLEETEFSFLDNPVNLFNLINMINSEIKKGSDKDSQKTNKAIKAWCKEFLGAIKSPRQYITEALDTALIEFFNEPRGKSKPDVSIMRQYTFQWGDGMETDMLEIAADKITKSKIAKKLKGNRLGEDICEVFGGFCDDPNSLKKKSDEIIKKLSTDLEKDLPNISNIVVGTSGRMATSMELLIKAYAFISNVLMPVSEDQLIPSAEGNETFYRTIFDKIGYPVTCHRVRFAFGSKRSVKRKVVDFAIGKAFDKSE